METIDILLLTLTCCFNIGGGQLTPNDFASLEQLQDRILQFEKYYEQAAQPFKWKFTRQDMDNLLRKIEAVRTDKSKAA